MIPQDFFFKFPDALYLIFFLPIILFLYFLLFVYRKKSLQIFASKINFSKIVILRSPFIYWLKVIFLSMSFFFALIALMQPEGNGNYVGENKEPFTLKKKAHDLIFLVDVSDSMLIASKTSKKTHLDLAKEIADEILSGLTGESAALYAFTSIPTKLSPSTLDRFFLRMSLRQMSINEGGIPGTDFSTTLEEISQIEFKDPNKLKTLIILSDGGDTSLEGLSEDTRKSYLAQIASKIPDPKKFNVRTFTIGIGSSEQEEIKGLEYLGKPVYVKLESDLLKLLSEKGDGNYYNSNYLTPLEIAKKFLQEMTPENPYIEENEKSDPKELIVYQLYFQIPLFISLFFLSLYLFLPNTLLFIKNTLPLFIIFCIPLDASKLDDELRVAKNFFQAQDENAALTAYQKILNQKLTSFEKAIVSYNLGTFFLENNHLDEAIEQLSSIHLTKKAPPFLTYRTYNNLSIAKFRKALEILTKKDEASLEKAIYFLKLSKKEIKKTQSALCDYQKQQGYLRCKNEPKLIKLEEAVAYHLNETIKTYGKPLEDPNSLQLFIKRIEDLEQKAKKSDPQEMQELQSILSIAIEMEYNVLLQTRFFNETDNNESDSLKVLILAQNKTLQVADHYLKKSFIIQEKNYKKEGCQKKPWNEILPMYHKGYESAFEALQLMPVNKEMSIIKQEEAIKYWRFALKKIDSSQEKPKKEENQQPLTNNQEILKDKSQKALQLLQEMQTHDKKQKAYQQQFKKEVERPW